MTLQILLMFVSALSYFAFMFSSLLLLFLNNPKSPFSSSASKSFNSVTTSVSICPISPMSLVRTLFNAFSEKSAIFFWQPAPYWRTIWVLVMSICAAKSFTIFCSSGVNTASGIFSASSFAGVVWSGMDGAFLLSAPKGSRVRVGASFIRESKSLFIS